MMADGEKGCFVDGWTGDKLSGSGLLVLDVDWIGMWFFAVSDLLLAMRKVSWR